MLALFRKLKNQNPPSYLQTLLFFVLCYLYLWLVVEPHLLYHGGRAVTNFPVFFTEWEFLRQFIKFPGGILEYLAAFLAQLFYISWLGAAVITILAWLICLSIDYILKKLNAANLRLIRFVPAILILITYARYTFHFTTYLAFLTALLFTSLYLKITTKNKRSDVIVFIVLSVILYYFAAAASLFFALLCIIYQLLFKHRPSVALCSALSALIIPYIIGTLLSSTSITEAFTDLLPISQRILTYETRRRMVEASFALYLLVPATFALIGLWQLAAKQKSARKHPKTKLRWYDRKPLLKWTLESALLLAITAAVLFTAHDKKLKVSIKADYYLCNRMWPQVLKAYNQNPNSFLIVYAVNQALYHTGQLSSQMFAYPQHPDTLFLTAKEHVPAYWKRSSVYFDLGVMNMAEGNLSEALSTYDQKPIILKRLALTNMVKGNLETAKVFLCALEKTLFHRKWARKYLQKIELDPTLSNDPQIKQIRNIALEKNIASSTYEPEQLLLALLQKNKKNKMAFEYLMAWYLATIQLDKFVQHLYRLDDFDYSGIPRHYEEAILLYQELRAKKVTIKGRTISKETHDRARNFANICNQYQGPGLENSMKAMYATAPDFIDTYFFYFNFGHLRMKK